jgi:uncharacterized membrane protein
LSSWWNFVLKNLAAPIIFFMVFRLAGTKPAIAAATAVTLMEAAILLFRGLSFSPFFIVAGVFTVVFGAVDLFITQPRYFRLEPFFQNMILGTVLGIAQLVRIPVAEWFAKALPEYVRPQLGGEMQNYLRKLTAVWVLYFYLKAALYLYLAVKVSLVQLVILRSFIGGGSLALMFFGEVIYRKLVFQK